MNDQVSSKKDYSKSGITLVAIMSFYLVSMGFSVVTPAMAKFTEHFAGYDVTYISTLPTIFVVVGTIICGSIMGKHIKFRTLGILASVIALVSGCAPAFFDNFAGLLVCRALFGFGVGLLKPIANALVLGVYEGDKQARYLGFGTMFLNLGGIIFQTLGGVLADVDWQLNFWGHALYIVPLIMAFFLPEIGNASEAELEEGKEKPQKKEKMSKKVWLPGLLLMVFQIGCYPAMLNVSTIFQERAIGGAAIASTSLTMYTVAGVISGLVFGAFFKKTRRVTLGLALLLAGIGALLVYLPINTYIVPTIGLMLIGFGFSVTMTLCYRWAGEVTPKSTVSTAASVLSALTYLGSFLSTYWLVACDFIAGDRIYFPLLVLFILCVILAIIFFIYCPFKREEQAAA